MAQNRILYIQFTNPAGYPPLQHSSRILADAGWQVTFLGTGVLGAKNLQFPPHQGISVQRIPFCAAGWKQKLHYFRYAIWAMWWTLTWMPKWIYASDSLSSPIALALSYLPGRKIIYHEHDTPDRLGASQLEAGAKQSRFQRFLFWARRKIAGRARVCVIPSQQRSESFQAEMDNGNLVKCVWNCPSREEVKLSSRPAESEDLILWYHGSIVPSQLPEAVVRALAMVRQKVKLKFAGYETVGHKGYVQELVDLARDLGIPKRVEYLGTLPAREDLLQACSRCAVGLALFTDVTRQPMAGASNKPFDYLSSGLALLMPDTPEWQEFYIQPGYGKSCDPGSAESIAAAINWFADHRAETRAMGEAGRQRILQDWNYETQFAPIQQLLARTDFQPPCP